MNIKFLIVISRDFLAEVMTRLEVFASQLFNYKTAVPHLFESSHLLQDPIDKPPLHHQTDRHMKQENWGLNS